LPRSTQPDPADPGARVASAARAVLRPGGAAALQRGNQAGVDGALRSSNVRGDAIWESWDDTPDRAEWSIPRVLPQHAEDRLVERRAILTLLLGVIGVQF